jgi:DNA-binding NtrC family response regulator
VTHPPHTPISARILVVDEEPAMFRFISTVLEGKGLSFDQANSSAQAIERVRSGATPDLVLMAIALPDQDGIATMEILRRLNPSLPVVILTDVADTRHVVQAVKAGAYDCLSKPFAPEDLERVVLSCPSVRPSSKPASNTLLEEIDAEHCFIAASPVMRGLRDRAVKIAASNIPILITGESGTGKEVMARLIHKASRRSERVLLKVNCAAIPSELLESELFGHEAGAFTGAYSTKPGKFELANKGTILLDEIGEMPPAFQAKLLQVLQDHSFSRLGGQRTIKADLRVIAATNVNIALALASRQLREDLYFRLSGATIHLPPLRERKEDIVPLLKYYITRRAELFACSPITLTPRVIKACMEHDWPGNVRELCNFVDRVLVLNDEDALLNDLHHQKVASMPNRPALPPLAAAVRSVS